MKRKEPLNPNIYLYIERKKERKIEMNRKKEKDDEQYKEERLERKKTSQNNQIHPPTLFNNKNHGV